MSGYWISSWSIWLSAFCVLAIYSYLVKDNPVYRVMIQVFIGANLGYQAVIQWRDVLYPQWWLPMLDGFRALFGGPGSPWGALWALVGLLGLLFYFQLSRKYFWLSRIVIGITIGIGAGLTFKSQFGQNMPQVIDSFKPLAPAVVAPAPRFALNLPGSDFPPAVAEPVAYFVKDREVSAVETLGGITLWRATMPNSAVAAPTIARNTMLIATGSGAMAIERSTGLFIRARPAFEDHPKVPYVGGKLLGEDAFHRFTITGQTITTTNLVDGAVLGSIALPDQPTATPATLEYDQPQFDQGVLAVAFGDEVRAYALRNGVAANVKQGDLLWRKKFPERIESLNTMTGVLLVQGLTQSQLWTLPVPSPKLQSSDYFDNWVFVITMITVMTYFFFSFKMENKAAKGASQLGRWILMVGFGAFFGNTVMTRMSYLLDRLMFLIDDWLRPFWHHLF